MASQFFCLGVGSPVLLPMSSEVNILDVLLLLGFSPYNEDHVLWHGSIVETSLFLVFVLRPVMVPVFTILSQLLGFILLQIYFCLRH